MKAPGSLPAAARGKSPSRQRRTARPSSTSNSASTRREGCSMLAAWIEWCACNRFLVFTGTLMLALAGVWSLRQISLDALPDISDVEVVIHTEWIGEPPTIIEDQVTYPIVTSL